MEDIDKKLEKSNELNKRLKEIKELIATCEDDVVKEKLDEVLKKYEKDRPRLLAEIAKVYMEKGQLDKAEEMVSSAVLENPLYTKGWLLKSDIALKKKKTLMEHFLP